MRELDSTENERCIPTEAVPHKLFFSSGIPQMASGGILFDLDFAEAKLKARARHLPSDDFPVTIAIGPSKTIYVNGLSGASNICDVRSETCIAKELLSPTQTGWKITKHKQELFFSNIALTANGVVVPRGRFNSSHGVILEHFDLNGNYFNSLTLRPILNPLESAESQNINVFPDLITGFGSRFIISGQRVPVLFVYALGK